jgi:hypothetical protein
VPAQDDPPLRDVSLAEYLLIAEAITGVDASVLARSARIGLAEAALRVLEEAVSTCASFAK